jgi:DNA-binding MarR family transcriptional regulator
MPDSSIRQLLNRRDLAATRHRAAISRQLGLGESEMLAVAHLAQRGRLTPGEIGSLLDLSSGGVSALVQRLEDAGHVVREPHPTDGRSNVVRLSPQLVQRASHVFDPLVSDLERLSAELDETQLRTIETFLTRVVEVSERHADRAYAKQRGHTDGTHATPVPTLWG